MLNIKTCKKKRERQRQKVKRIRITLFEIIFCSLLFSLDEIVDVAED